MVPGVERRRGQPHVPAACWGQEPQPVLAGDAALSLCLDPDGRLGGEDRFDTGCDPYGRVVLYGPLLLKDRYGFC